MRYLTKDWYLLCQTWPMPEAVKRQIDDAVAARQAAMEREQLPEALYKAFMFHDGELTRVCEGEDYIIELDSPYSTYHRITFQGARVRQDMSPEGATWLYEELYRHKSGHGYEVHILLQKHVGRPMRASDLCELKIVCEDILLA